LKEGLLQGLRDLPPVVVAADEIAASPAEPFGLKRRVDEPIGLGQQCARIFRGCQNVLARD
jgi:hypothetical protein